MSKENVGNKERFISVVSGLILFKTIGLPKNMKSALGLGLAASLVYRGFSGSCKVYSALGLNYAGNHSGSNVYQRIFIGRSPQEVYQFWKDYNNYPKFIKNLVSVEELDSDTTRWTLKTAIGKMSWQGRITADKAGHYIAWKSLPGADVENIGSVEFHPAPFNGTEVHVHLRYNPPGGKYAASLADLIGNGAKRYLAESLKRSKKLLENGETASVRNMN